MPVTVDTSRMSVEQLRALRSDSRHSYANRHKAGPGNIMQPPGTKVSQVGTKLLPLVPKLAEMVPKYCNQKV